MKSFRSVVTLVAALVTLSLQSRAATLVWTNSASGAWSTAANWSPNAVPAAGDAVLITNSGTYTVSFNASVSLASLTIGHTNATGIQQLANLGGALTVTNVSSASNGVLHLSSGTFTTAGAADLVGPVNHNTGTWQLLTPINLNVYNLTNGELRGANCVITNLNWRGGSLNSDALGTTTTIPVGGKLNIFSATAKTLSYYVAPGRTLINHGTATWSGAAITGQGNATINNTSSLTLNDDSAFVWGSSGNAPVLLNSGTLTKAGGTGSFTLGTIILNNSGTMNIDSGSFTVSGQWLNSGSFSIANGALSLTSSLGTSTNTGTLTLGVNGYADFVAGTTTLGGTIISPAANRIRFNGGIVNLNTTNLSTPTLWLAGATLNQNTNVVVNELNQAAGTWQLNVPTVINNYNLTNGELRGANNTITNFNWFGGSLNSDALGNTTTVAPGGTLSISGPTAKTMSYWVAPGRTLVNLGTANWSGAGIVGQGGATIQNTATMTLAGDFSFAWGGAGNGPVFRNHATLILSNGSDLTLSSASFDNQAGAGVYLDNASLTIGAGSLATNSGLLNLNSGSFLQHSGTTFTLGGAVVAPAGNSLRFAGTSTFINTTNLSTPSLWQQGGTVYQNTNVVVNTYNHQAGTFQATLPVAFSNYNMTNAEIRGANLTITNFNWLGGSINADGAGSDTLFIPPGGTLNISGPTAKTLSYYTAPGRTLFNNGTAMWSGAGITGQGGAQLANNATMTLAGDFSFAWGGAGNGPVLRNYATMILSNGTDFTLTTAILDNQASAGIYFNSGSITVGAGSLATNSGLLNLDGGSFLQHSGASLTLGGTVVAPAANSLRFAGTSTYIVTTNLNTPSLWQQAGTVYQNTNVVVNTYNQQAGIFSATLPVAWNNYNMTNAEIRGANVTITNFNWLGGSLNADGAGSDTVTIPVGGTLNISGATGKTIGAYVVPGRTLINNGTATWSGAGITGYYGPQLVNNGALTLAGDFSLAWGGFGNGPVLRNTSSLTLSNGSDFTLSAAILDNPSSGGIHFTNGSITIGASSIATNHGALNLDTTSFFQFSGATLWVNGSVTAPTANSLRFAGTSAYITTTNITSPSLWQQGGTIYQMTNVVVNSFNQQAGVFYATLPVSWNNYNMTNAELRGANVTITNFNWLGGSLNGDGAGSNTITIPTGGTLNISGATAKTISTYVGTGRALQNLGTATWSGAGITGYYGPTLSNSGTMTLNGDFALAWGGFGNGPVLRNTGTLNLSSGSDFSLASATLDNQSGASVNLTAGSLTIGASSIGTNSGALNLDASSFFLFSGATLSLGGDVVAPTTDSLRLAGTATYIVTPNIASPSLWQQGGTLYQMTNVVVNTFNQQAGAFYATLPVAWNNYNMTNAELRGANVTITNFNWLGGSLNSDGPGSNTVTIPASGTLKLTTTTAKYQSAYIGTGRNLQNHGTGTWSGGGIIGYYGPTVSNLGTLTLTSDAGIAWGGLGGAPVLQNNGTFTKNAGTGTANFSTAIITNAGTFTISSGAFAQTGADFTQTSGSANLGTNFNCGANVRVLAGTFAGRGNIAGTFYNNGLSSAGAPLGLITGTSWTNSATGIIRFELGGTNPGTNFDQFRLTGPATVNGTADLALLNGFVPVPGNTFTCIVTSARSGVFTNLTFSGGYEFSALYTPTTVVFRAENALPVVNLTVLNGNTQLVCTPFKLLATASDVGGTITNISVLQDGTTIANANSGSTTATGESDFPLDVTFVAEAIDDQGGKSWATQTVSLTTSPLHVLQLGGKRANGVFKFCMTGETGSNYMVLATTNIAEPSVSWTQLGLMENTNGIWRYYDNGTMTNRPYRFYRAQQQ